MNSQTFDKKSSETKHKQCLKLTFKLLYQSVGRTARLANII